MVCIAIRQHSSLPKLMEGDFSSSYDTYQCQKQCRFQNKITRAPKLWMACVRFFGIRL